MKKDYSDVKTDLSPLSGDDVYNKLTEKAQEMRAIADSSRLKPQPLTLPIEDFEQIKADLEKEIAARKKAEGELKKSHELYRQMFSGTHAVKLLIDPSTGRIVDANPAAIKYFGYSKERLSIIKIWDIICLSRDEMKNDMALAEAGISSYFQYKGKVAPDIDRYVEVYMGSISLEDKTLLHAIIHDDTERRVAEDALRQIAADFSQLSGDEFYRAVTRHLSESFGMDFALVGVFAEGSKSRVRTLAVYGQGKDMDLFEYELDGTPCENVMGKEICSYSSDVQTTFPKDLMLADIGAESYIGIPLFDKRGEALGIVALLDDKPRPDWTAVESAIKVFAGRVSAEIERQKNEEELRSSREFLKGVFECIQDGISVVDTDYNILHVNHAMEKWHSRQAPLQGKKCYSAYARRDEICEECPVEKAIKRGTLQSMEMETAGRSGSKKWIEMHAFPMKNERGEVIGVVEYIRDISKRKKAQHALEKSLSLYAATLESTTDGILVVNNAGKIVSHNKLFAEMWRIPRSIIDKGDSADVLGYVKGQLKDQENFVNKVKEVYGNPDENSFDLLEFTDGRIMERYSVPQRLDGKTVGRVWSFRNVTERKEMEAILNGTLRELDTILESAEVGITLIKSSKVRWINKKMTDLFGYTRLEVEGAPVEVYHKSPEAFGKLREKALAAVSRGETFDTDLQMKRKGGALFWARLLGKAIDPENPANGTIWIVEDITRRRAAEERIRLAGAVFENTIEGIMITDSKSVIQFVNPAFTRVTGYDSEEIIGQTPKLLNSGRQDDVFYKEMWKILGKTGRWQGEVWNRRKNGDIYPEWLSIASIYNERGEVTHYASIFNDITDRKHHEEQINFLAFHDSLTELPNRQLFYERLDLEITHAKREKSVLAVMFMDLDRFKEVNDSLGHDAGDILLKEVAARLKKCVRESDTVSRLGGDEFTLLLPNIGTEENAAIFAGKILSSLREPITVMGSKLAITSSIGVSLFPKNGKKPETLVKRADHAMYTAKQSGKNNFKFYGE